jgi:hypothetical protein
VIVPKKIKELTNALAELSAETLPSITSSAVRAMHHFAPYHHRKLLQINSHGYVCSMCGRRFPDICDPEGHFTSETLRRLLKAQRDDEFAHHICSERPRPADN